MHANSLYLLYSQLNWLIGHGAGQSLLSHYEWLVCVCVHVLNASLHDQLAKHAFGRFLPLLRAIAAQPVDNSYLYLLSMYARKHARI